MLRGMGYVIREAADGQQALNSISKSRPDVILLNLYLPKVSGLDVLELGRRGLLEQVHFPRDYRLAHAGARHLREGCTWPPPEAVSDAGPLVGCRNRGSWRVVD